MPKQESRKHAFHRCAPCRIAFEFGALKWLYNSLLRFEKPYLEKRSYKVVRIAQLESYFPSGLPCTAKMGWDSLEAAVSIWPELICDAFILFPPSAAEQSLAIRPSHNRNKRYEIGWRRQREGEEGEGHWRLLSSILSAGPYLGGMPFGRWRQRFRERFWFIQGQNSCKGSSWLKSCVMPSLPRPRPKTVTGSRVKEARHNFLATNFLCKKSAPVFSCSQPNIGQFK